MTAYTIEINDHFPDSPVDQAMLRDAIRRVLVEEGIAGATISLAIVTDAEIHRVNREFLNHDYPTDVISFLLNSPDDESTFPFYESDTDDFEDGEEFDVSPDSTFLDGELVVSLETARREAVGHGWSLQAELLLYVVHGLLHLCGYDDLTDESRPVMRAREREILSLWEYYPTGLET
ncbi:rRNA maturation RNase YbeY [Schlesneria sp. DSM 10557]|uniref:rRNA maturation RNase YbeY n=2 Tax=unclassified Schlesneria TaxID=2762017 RepID=UPI00359F7343